MTKITLAAIGVFTWCLSCAVASEISGQPCERLDLSESYRGWRCEDIVPPAVEGTDYRVRLRWNRPGQSSLATVVWLAGGDGSTPHAEFDTGLGGVVDARPIRDKLDRDERIRSVEVQFLNPSEGNVVGFDVLGGYWASPRTGYLKAARAFREVLAILHRPQTGLLQGDWLTLAGSSNGATIIAYLLAFLQGDAYAERIVMISGPFAVKQLYACNDPSYVAYTGINDAPAAQNPVHYSGAQIRTLLSAWNGGDCTRVLFSGKWRSTFHVGAQRHFPTSDISVIMGGADEFGPWILRSNAYWYDHISAARKTRIVLDNVAHQAFGVSEAADAAIFQALRAIPSTLR